MTFFQKAWIWFLICAPLFLFVIYLAGLRYQKQQGLNKPEKQNRNGMQKALVFSLFLLLAIFGVRYALSYYSILTAEAPLYISSGELAKAIVNALNAMGMEGSISADAVAHDLEQILGSLGLAAKETPTLGEAAVNSFFYTLRTLGVEEGYPELVRNLREMAGALVPVENPCYPFFSTTLVWYLSVLELIAPIMGGALILEALARVFPKFRLWVNCFVLFWRKKYYFSELNAASLALAKSIFQEKKKEKPVFVFTDTYLDDEKEKDYELLLEAKRYGAICVRDDILHVIKPRYGKREYYLMDQNEFANLQTLLNLVEDHILPYVWDSRIYLFVQSDSYISIETQVNSKLENALNKNEKRKKKEKPLVVPVRGYRNLVSNLFVEVPLYEPLIHKKDPSELNVTILGNGMIGTEAFLNIYWLGQMLVDKVPNENGTPKDLKLTVNVISKDEPESFWSKLDYINPEIRKTSVVRKEKGEEEAPQPEYLRFNETETTNPYCYIRYLQADVKNGGFWSGKTETEYHLLESDYYIVALGNDADNISVAEKLRCLIGKTHLESKASETENDLRRTVVAYAVFDSKVASSLNQKRRYQCREKGKTDLYLYAFGNLDQVYSCENVYMSQSQLLAEESGTAYRQIHREEHIKANKKRARGEDDNYSYWSNMAKAMHMKYKAFSLGWITASVFYDGSEQEETKLDESYREEGKENCRIYKKMALIDGQSITPAGKDLEKYEDLKNKRECLAWLEHRRWCAYTRAVGYQYTAEVEKNLNLNGKNHKNMPLKLHPCLVEAKRPTRDEKYQQDQIARLFEKGATCFEVQQLLDQVKKDPMDRLDWLTCQMCEEWLKRNQSIGCYDFKQFDYIGFEFSNYILASVLKKSLETKGVRLPAGFFTPDEKEEDLTVEIQNQDGKIETDRFLSIEKVKEKLQGTYYRVDEERWGGKALLLLCSEGAIKGAFELEGTWFAPCFSVFAATPKRFKMRFLRKQYKEDSHV